MSQPVSITYFLEVLSSWCFWAEPTWSALKERFGESVRFDWKIALMPPSAFPQSRAQCDAYYRRSGTVVRSDFMLDSGWFEEELRGDYHAANRVAEAGKDFGFEDDRLRLALTRAGLREGRKIGRLDTCIEVAVQHFEVDGEVLKKHALSAAVERRIQESTRQFHAFQIDQRPAFLIESAIADRAIFSGVIDSEPLVATIEAMVAHCRAYASFHTHFGPIQ